MQFTLDQLRSYAVGTDRWAMVDGAATTWRLPAVMDKLYRDGSGAEIRLQCTAGVRVRFVSDSRFLRLSLHFGPYARPILKGNLLVDQEDPILFGPDEPQLHWDDVVFESSQTKPRCFDLWLPHLGQTRIRSLELAEGATLHKAPRFSCHWMAYGDSITQGMTARNPANTYVARCALALNADLLNLGVGGAKLIPELANTVPAGSFDLISIAYGTNDFNISIPVEQYAANARALLNALAQRHPTVRVLLITPLTWVDCKPKNEIGASLDDYRRALESLAIEFPRVLLVPGQSLVPHDAACFVDKVHPNDHGMDLYARNLLPYLRQALNQR